MNKNSIVLIACLVLLLAGGIYYFVREEPPAPPTAPSDNSNIQATTTFSGSSLVEERDGKRQWELSAETIEMDPNTQMVYLKNIKGIFYQDNGGKIEVNAPQATINGSTRDIQMEGGVKAVATDGSTLTAAQMQYNTKERRFNGSGSVTVSKDDTVITGDRIESDANLEKVRVQGNAKVVKGGKHE